MRVRVSLMRVTECMSLLMLKFERTSWIRNSVGGLVVSVKDSGGGRRRSFYRGLRLGGPFWIIWSLFRFRFCGVVGFWGRSLFFLSLMDCNG